MSSYHGYRSCCVPLCKNTVTKTKEKIFFHMPSDPARRKKWCSMMKRDLPSEKSHFFVCEDHFDLENDMDNYIRYKLQGGRVKIKKDSFPHKFHCQKRGKAPTPSTERKFKRDQKKIVQELLNAYVSSKSTPGRPFALDNAVLVTDSSSTLQVKEEPLQTAVTTPSEAISQFPKARRKPIPDMVGCSAVGCTNGSEQGYLMKIFPKDPERRKLWISNVNRQNWEPTKCSSLCEVHFDEDQWEKSTDKYGRKIKIIKKDAVPTIFFTSPNVIRSPTLDCHSDVHGKARPYNDLDKGNEQNPDSTVLSIVMDLEIENEQNHLLTLLSNDLDIEVKNVKNPNLTVLSKESDLEVENEQNHFLTLLSNDLDPVRENELKPDSAVTPNIDQVIKIGQTPNLT